ncbi:Putative DNA helicase ino80 [Brettanomyces nanus]|uniref:Chromatin-remodeling ATPase INO80 n=1 Tax=Eeniella nana TaxID=13502 RepID=A0A875S0Z0_EENNA|nr:Putative DNA helicase ino80 [Brettanomyces nanus]QPG75411.1 Putative DNA helicase ino80 [Brettanomyces nanus]
MPINSLINIDRGADYDVATVATVSAVSGDVGVDAIQATDADGSLVVDSLASPAELLANFRNKLKATAAIDTVNQTQANGLKLMKNEFQLLATTNGIFIEPRIVDELKNKLVELEPKIFEKISRRSRLVRQEEEPLRRIKNMRLRRLVELQKQKDAQLKLLHKIPSNIGSVSGPSSSYVNIAPKEGGKRRARDSVYYEEEPRKRRRRGGNASTDSENIASRTFRSHDDGHKLPTIKLTLKPRLTMKEQRAITKQYDNTYISIWKDLSRKDGPKAYRLFQQSLQAKQVNLRKTCQLATRESRRWKVKTTKSVKDQTTKARRSMREMLNFWKKNEREEKMLRMKAEQEAIAKAKKEEDERESKRQARKLNFLINQTELYSHFIGSKIKTQEYEGEMADKKIKSSNGSVTGTAVDAKNVDLSHANKDFHSLNFDEENEEELRKTAAANAKTALLEAKKKADRFNDSAQKDSKQELNNGEMNFQNPSSIGDISIPPPKMLDCTLKEYQKKGLNWLASLYEQGINGILADEMGLGKTVQSISVLAYLAETHNIWGPFLVVTPASTLHNWQQEITRFLPDFKVLPYWGTAKDRKILRKFWDRKSIVYHREAAFHVVVTSYQLVVADSQYFQKMRWQYMILDEAQAIKSSQSSRWKSLLTFQCRNRLLLTGTPIQNNMQELWALLHFIMPSLFDSHDEFSEWFSKDIESHAQAHTKLNQLQLERLHAILKPFMLRRVKKNVQSELGEKIEIDVYCELTSRQKKLYKMLRSQINLMDLIENSKKIHHRSHGGTDYDEDGSGDSLMNVVMQFRKVCNHPDLFERADTKSAFICGRFAETASLIREGNQDLLEVDYTTQNTIQMKVPRLIQDELLSPSYDHGEIYDRVVSIPKKFSIWNPENFAKSGDLLCLRLLTDSANDLIRQAHRTVVENAIDLRSYNVTESSDLLSSLKSVRRKVCEDMYLATNRQCAFESCRAPPIEVRCSNQRFTNRHRDKLFNEKFRAALHPLSLNNQWDLYKKKVPLEMWPKAEMLPEKLSNEESWSTIRLPSIERFVLDSGKLKKLDQMLPELKKNDHKCLMYFQMTRMMDLMEEYLNYRQYKYIRLDGSSRLSDRRDLVYDFQTRPEIFIFLLSTRAGGLGINLTAADTVIFYDSDWNPTIDSQAMDRAHRLGQTRQVTVYRLLVKNTIEERMRDRAKQKEQVQKVVMGGKIDEDEESTEKDGVDENENENETGTETETGNETGTETGTETGMETGTETETGVGVGIGGKKGEKKQIAMWLLQDDD